MFNEYLIKEHVQFMKLQCQTILGNYSTSEHFHSLQKNLKKAFDISFHQWGTISPLNNTVLISTEWEVELGEVTFSVNRISK